MKKMIAVVFFVVLICTGCSNNISLTTEQSDLVAEYAGGVLVKYSFDNQWKYTKLRKAQGEVSGEANTLKKNKKNIANSTLDISTTKDTSTTKDKADKTVSKENSDLTTVDDSVTDILQLIAQRLNMKETTISYNRYSVVSSYPEGDLVLSVPAGNGNKMIAVEFTINNSTDSPIICNTASSKLNIQLQINDQTGVVAKQTMLKNDLLNLNNVTINPKENISAVALFFVPQDKADNISSLTLSVDGNGQNALTKKIL